MPPSQADDAKGLRAWLLPPHELIDMARQEFRCAAFMLGAAHPALLCAALYGNRLRAWKDAETIAEGILEIEPLGIGDRQDEGGGAGGFGVEPLARIEA